MRLDKTAHPQRCCGWAILALEDIYPRASDRSAAARAAGNQAHNEKQDYRADKGCQERPEYPASTCPKEQTQNDATNDGTDDAHNNVTQDAKTTPPHHQTGQPSRQPTNDNPYNPAPDNASNR